MLRLLAVVINRRLLEFTESRGLRSPVQAGFRPGMACSDQLMALQHFIDQQVIEHKARLYCCFVDLKGAYDTVPRSQLWQTLISLGIHGEMLRLIQGLYANSFMCANIAGRHGDLHKSEMGVKQGCPLSPTLFGLYMDCLHSRLRRTAPGDGPPISNGQRVPALMYADDIVLMATTAAGLQRLIDATQQLCNWKKMTVSQEKTAVVVFKRIRDKAPDGGSWQCGGSLLRKQDAYKYLGIVFSSTRGVAGSMLEVQRRQNAAWALLKRQYLHLTRHFAVQLMLRLYLAIVPPTASYGSEVWGLRYMPGICSKQRQQIVQRHEGALRQISGLRRSVPADLVERELEVQQLQQQWQQQGLRLWNKIAQLPEDSVYKTIARDDLTAAHQCGVRNWAAGLLALAEQYSLQLTDVMGNPQAVDLQQFTDAADAAAAAGRDSLAACDPRTAPSKGAKACTYQAWFARPYWARGPHFWEASMSTPQRRAIMRLRLGSHELPVETGRQQRPPLPRHERLCTACVAAAVGDERHMMMECEATAAVRENYADLFVQPHLSMQQLVWHPNRNRVVAFILDCLATTGLISESSRSCND